MQYQNEQAYGKEYCVFVLKACVEVYNIPTIIMVPSRYLIPFLLAPVVASPLK